VYNYGQITFNLIYVADYWAVLKRQSRGVPRQPGGPRAPKGVKTALNALHDKSFSSRHNERTCRSRDMLHYTCGQSPLKASSQFTEGPATDNKH